MRARYRFAEWTLTADSNMSVRYVGKCLSCGERSIDSANPDDAQLWCLRHAGRTGDNGYEMIASQYFDAARKV